PLARRARHRAQQMLGADYGGCELRVLASSTGDGCREMHEHVDAVERLLQIAARTKVRAEEVERSRPSQVVHARGRPDQCPHFYPAREQGGDHVAAEKSVGAGDQDLHAALPSKCPGPRAPPLPETVVSSSRLRASTRRFTAKMCSMVTG